ncbi:histidinol phosphate phosphatase HisJ family protein [Biscogniauxia mediterranea]|nr:histidinol phosphate phosphatase HisJ family protein [Biscogniauxia mediterranea]
MAFTMHSHSGQFCPGHAKDQLEEVIQHAISLGYTTMGLTEHMPRTHLEDLYPEELDNPSASLAELFPRHAAYLAEAARLRAKYAGQIELVIGFEGEWLRPAYAGLVAELAAHPDVDYFVGSLHHVKGVPIDYDRAYYLRAQALCGPAAPGPGVDEEEDEAERRMHEAYYDEQYAMLTALQPRVVGHFDLIRLLSASPGRDVRAAWPGVWARVRRNLAHVAGYGGLLECNSSALRKGLAEPYPARAVAEEWLRLGGRFTLSDDSHGVAQLGTNYARALDYLAGLGVAEVWTLSRRRSEESESSAADEEDQKKKKAARLEERPVPLEEIRAVVSKWEK